MKILCIADIHGELDFVSKAGKFAKKQGIKDIIILGDFPAYGKFRDVRHELKNVEYVLRTLKELNLNVLAIPGNCDSREILELFEKFNVNLHDKVRDIYGTRFVGLGGSNPTPFNTPFDLSEEEIYIKLKENMEKCRAKNKNIVLITHVPPKDTRCDNARRGHVGSVSVRKIIEEFRPDLAVCSHVHECGGTTDKIGKTTVANIGTLAETRCGIIDAGTLDIELKLMQIG